jgi:7-cyano-7-deazaguanine synthase in queuosine biosynthesis
MVASAPWLIKANCATVEDLPPSVIPGHLVELEYRDLPGRAPNVRVGLPRFVRDLYHLAPRLLDLLEIAAYVYAADRFVSRGAKDSVEYHAWSRDLTFFVRVRDYAFWARPDIRAKLGELLAFLSGNQRVDFHFQPGHSTPPTSLLDGPDFGLDLGSEPRVILFSGGLDSLTGVLQQLRTTSSRICLVSHQSGAPSIKLTQRALTGALARDYPNRIEHFRFECGLTGERAEEETQRTRFFLYTAIAFVLARSLEQTAVWAFENGVTSLNFPKRQDMQLGRASRTTHPRTISLLSSFFSEVADIAFTVETPFFHLTKADVLVLLKELGGDHLLTSSVSCSKTFKVTTGSTHCGGCSQCVDRRFAVFASALDDLDESRLYSLDFLSQPVPVDESRTTLIDYLVQACRWGRWGLDDFYQKQLNELAQVEGYLGQDSEEAAVKAVWALCARHGQQVIDAVRRMRQAIAYQQQPVAAGAVLTLINDQQHVEELRAMADPTQSEPLLVFFSYSHKDEKLRDKLAEHLRLMERKGLIRSWHDRCISAGTEWEGQISKHLERAGVILLLVSPSFIDSNYCYDVELKRAMERHDKGEALVIPVILRPCAWQEAPFGKLQALPKDGKPVASKDWHNHDTAMLNIAEGIEKAITALRQVGTGS